MGAIVDVLLLGKAELSLLTERYPHCMARALTNSPLLTQKYRVIIPNEELDIIYYNFLVDNNIAFSSSNFRMRIESDEVFYQNMKKRAIGNISVQAREQAVRQRGVEVNDGCSR